MDGATGREAWEALAARGAVPFDWVEAPGRAYVYEANTYGDPARAGALVTTYRVQRHPPSPAAAAALAACGAPALLGAEALAREAARRLVAAGAYALPAAALDAVVWLVATSGELARAAQGLLPAAFEPVATATVEAYAQRLVYSRLPSSLAVPSACRVEALDYFWRALAVAAWSRRRRAWYAARPSPFEPLLALERAGFRLWDATPVALVLAAPGGDAAGRVLP